MSADPQISALARHLRVVTETTGRYDADELSPGEAAGGERHARIPDTVLYCKVMSVGARLLYGMLQRHNGAKGCFPSQAILAEELGSGERSVRRYLDELEDAGFVRADARRGIGGGGSLATSYRLFPAGDAPTNRPKRADEPAFLAGSQRDEPAKNDRRTGQNVQDEPAKIDMHIKVEPKPVNQSQLTSNSAAACAREADQPTLIAPDPQVAAVIDALALKGDASSRAIAAIFAEFPAINHASAAACCAEWCANKRITPTARRYREWCKRERPVENGASNANPTQPTSGRTDAPGRPRGNADVPHVPGGTEDAKARTEQWIRSSRAKLDAILAAEGAGTVPGMPVSGE